jgi:PAX-interacting protein 1
MQNVITNINQPNPPNVQIAQQQQQQAANQQQNIIQNQNNRQNIVIINQVQNPQQMNSLAIQNQRFQNANQMKPQQQQQVPGQQIIQQKIISTTGDQQIVQTPMTGNVTTQPNQQIIQVHQSPISGPTSVQQQQNVNINVNVNDQGVTNQAMTQAQAVQQIAQQLQSGTEIISNPMSQQQMTATPMNQQMNIISQSPVQQQQNVGNQSPQIAQSPQWIPQSPTQQPPQSPIQTAGGMQTVQHHIITTNQPGATQISGGQYIRATGSRMDTHIYLDAQSSAQFAKMDQREKKEYLEKLHKEQQQRGVMFQQRPNAPNVLAGARPQHHIVIRSQMPQGLNQQQQMQWIQQSQRRQFVIRPGAPGQPGQIPGQNVTQFTIDPNATPQQQQILRQQQQQNFQRLQQLQQNQKMQQQQQQGGPPTPNSPRGPGNFVANEPMDGIQIPIDPSNKTKTALANMLSNRLGNNGNVTQVVEQPEQSAAGTLRMMTAQHNATMNVPGIPPGVVRTPQEMIVLQQQQQQQGQLQPQIVGGQQIIQGHPQMQQRRQLTNITNAGGKPQVIVQTNPIASGPQVMISQSPNSNMKSPVAFSPGRAPAITNRAQFYGHNPNLKLPPDLFLLGCHFLIVEYTDTNADELPEWQKTIKHHGGEIESFYNARVTHVLCRTQKHGIVMQAIRDNKRCVTVYWLNDMILNKTVAPPWQAIHLPAPGIFGYNMKPGSKHIITIMGFEGDERERVKRMIEESGAKLTTYMNRQNTVVVCKKLDQTHKKYIHAKEFNIPMVNLVWLSDLLLGNTSAISLYDSPKYQQYNLPTPLKIDPTIVIQLMSKLMKS